MRRRAVCRVGVERGDVPLEARCGDWKIGDGGVLVGQAAEVRRVQEGREGALVAPPRPQHLGLRCLAWLILGAVQKQVILAE